MFLRAGAISLVLLLASRLLGLLRESAQAAAFGASAEGDIAVLMLTLPDWLAGLLASGALAYVLLPYWAGQTPVQQQATQRRVLRWLVGLGFLAGATLWLMQAPLLAAMAPGVPAALRASAGGALVFSALALPLALVAALWATRLQHQQDFVGLYAANLVVNGIIVVALLFVAGGLFAAAPLDALGWVLLAAMVARLLWLGRRLPGLPVPASLSSSGSSSVSSSPASVMPPLPRASQWLWASLAAGLPLALPFIARSLASGEGQGALALFNYAWKLVELPLVLAIGLVASLALPTMTRALAAGDDATRPTRSAFALAWALACACAAALAVGAQPLAQLLFGWGRMTPDDVRRVAQWAALGGWSLLPQALIAIALALLAARRQLRRAALTYAAVLALLLPLALWARLDGAGLMLWLVAVFALVALALLAASWPLLRASLPWREMALPLAAAVLLPPTVRTVLPAAWWSQLPLALGLAALTAMLVAAAACLTGPALRAALRR